MQLFEKAAPPDLSATALFEAFMLNNWFNSWTYWAEKGETSQPDDFCSVSWHFKPFTRTLEDAQASCVYSDAFEAFATHQVTLEGI